MDRLYLANAIPDYMPDFAAAVRSTIRALGHVMRAIDRRAEGVALPVRTSAEADAEARRSLARATGRPYDLRKRCREAEGILAAEGAAATALAETATFVAEAAALTLVTASEQIFGTKIPRRVAAPCFAKVVADVAHAVAAAGAPVAALAATAALSAAAEAAAAEAGSISGG